MLRHTTSLAGSKLPLIALVASGGLMGFLFAQERTITGRSPDMPRPLTLSIGFDRSQTMSGATLADTTLLRKICVAVLATGRPAIIAFDAISAPSDLALLRLALEPSFQPTGISMSKRAMAARKNRVIALRNRQQIEIFLHRCQQRIDAAGKNAGYTDLSGYFHKINRFHYEPQFVSNVNMAFVQTDGYQDIPKQRQSNRQLECPEWKKGLVRCSSNWKNNRRDCGFTNFESPEGFLHFFTQQMKN